MTAVEAADTSWMHLCKAKDDSAEASMLYSRHPTRLQHRQFAIEFHQGREVE
jgi:hypothetical protein